MNDWMNGPAWEMKGVEVVMIIIVAFFAGVLTTVAGMGGGMLLVLCLVLMGGSPVDAFAATSFGLLAGNLHRLWLFRGSVQWSLARPFALGALPVAVLAGLVVVSIPTVALKIAIAFMALLAVAGVAFGLKIRPPRTATAATGALVGGVSATTGGGGLLAGPFLLASGLTGDRYIATGASFACAVHVGRLIGYGGGGAVTPDIVALGAAFAVAIPLGNLAGKWVRPRIPAGATRPIELTTAGVLATLAIVTVV